MAIKTQFSKPTPSQWASAACHLERQDEWTWFRVNGERYVSLPSSNSGKTYWVRATADGCSCPWYATTFGQCSHMLCVYLQATLDELAEEQARIDAAIDETLASISWDDLRAAFPGCAGGCGNITENRSGFCDDCGAARERQERLAAARARVMEEWTA